MSTELKLLEQWQRGSLSARDQLVELLYPELKRIASAYLRNFGANVSLFTTDLTHNVVQRLIVHDPARLVHRKHILSLASVACRNLLLDLARKKNRLKRKGLHVTFDDQDHSAMPGKMDVEQLYIALVRLEAINPEQAEIITMRFFGGQSVEKIAEALGVSVSTIRRKSEAAFLWLADALTHEF